MPVVALIEESTDETWSVLEVSSFQLESTEQFHPAIAVILNITPDHLDRHGTFENYALAKERIFAAQNEQDFVVLNADNRPRRGGRPAFTSQRLLVFDRASGRSGRMGRRTARSCTAPPKTRPLRPSCRSAASLSRASTTSRMCSPRSAPRALPAPPSKRSARAVENFKAVEHRLEYVATLNGVEFYNDSKATNVDATAKAIAAFSWRIHLILGGKDKNSDYTQLSDLLRARVRAVYTIGSAAAKIESHLRGVVSIHSCETLDKAVSAIAAAGASRRRGAAGPRLLQLRPVRKLRAPRPRLQGTRQRMARLEGLAERIRGRNRRSPVSGHDSTGYRESRCFERARLQPRGALIFLTLSF